MTTPRAMRTAKRTRTLATIAQILFGIALIVSLVILNPDAYRFTR